MTGRISPHVDERRVDPDGWGPVVEDVHGPQIVVGGPGTGKTEFLVRRAVHLLTRPPVPGDRVPGEQAPGDQLLVLSFGRRGAADLDRRIHRGLAETAPGMAVPSLAVTTFHGLAVEILETHGALAGWRSPPKVLTGPEQVALVRELLGEERPGDWSFAFSGLLGSSTFAGELTDFLLRASEQMLDGDDIARLAVDRDDWRGIPEFMERYRDELTRRSRIDYGTLLAEAATILERGEGPLLPHRFVLVDEYQDTTVSQTRLLAALAPGGDLTVAADPYQSIYSFRGATLRNVDRFPERFGAAGGREARRVVLTTSFRTPQRILDAAERVAAHDLPGTAGPVVPTPAEGRVDVFGFEQHTEEAEWIAGEVVRLHLEEAIPYREMGVFVRSTRRFVPELSRALERRGVAHDLPTSRQAEQPAARFLLDLVSAATTDDPGLEDRVMRRILLGPWFAAPLGRVRDLERERAGHGLGWVETLRMGMEEGTEPLAALLADPRWATGMPAADGAWQVWTSLPQLAVVAEEGRHKERASWTSLLQVLARWNERNPDATLVEYARLLLDESFEARPLLRYTPPDEDRLTVTTLHQAKGLELDVVFIADAVEGVLPDLRGRDSLLGVRHLLPDVPREPAAYRRFRLQEERRLAYTAMTRARRRVVWTATSTGFESGTGVPSRFLALVAGTETVAGAISRPGGDRAPVTVTEAEARLRRLAADPAVSGPRRLAALDVLASGPGRGLRPPDRYAGMRRRRPDTGLVPPDVVLSPTQADQYERCPRRYALERRLGVGAEPGLHAELGRLVHRVLERVERSARERGEARGTLDAALVELDHRFDDDLFGPGPIAVAWKRRARQNLASLYTRWPSRGEVVAVERELAIEIGGVRWFGVADRIERRDGTLTVVDYKTGSTALTVAEAASSLQLGFYLLAARHDPELRREGEPTGAELWYPWAGRSRQSVPVRALEVSSLEDVAARLESAAEGIIAERWAPRPSGECDRCQVRTLCPAQPEGREAFLT